MKLLAFLSLLFCSLIARANTDGEVLHVKIDWVNAKECGIEGCKPLSFIQQSGLSFGFQWPEAERGLFQLQMTAVNEGAKIEIKRTYKPKGESSEQTISLEKFLAYGAPTEVTVGDLRWLLTVTKEPPKPK